MCQPGERPIPEDADLARLQDAYADRARRLAGSDRYTPFNPVHLFTLQQRQRAVLKLLRKEGFAPLAGRAVLEVGCGAGCVLHEFLGYGADREGLHGTDLRPAAVMAARACLGELALTISDGQALPYPSAHFDLALQYTMFSSILEPAIKDALAAEMLRVLKPGGMLIWYDFIWNPANRQTRGITRAELRALFPGCRLHSRRITLAPPLARRLVGISWLLAAALERAGLFNSHLLAAICKPGNLA